VHAHLYRGETYFRAGQIPDSWKDFQAAAEQAGKLGELEERWKALYGLGRISALRGDIVKSDELLQEAVGAIESLRAGLKKPSLRSDFLADKRDVYDLLIEHKTASEDVFRLMEQSRARNLQDRMALAPPSGLAEVARRLPLDTALLEYWIGPASASVLWVRRGGHGVRRWSVSQKEAKMLAGLAAVMSDASRQDWRTAANRVAGQLLADVPALQRAGIRRLVIVPDDVLTGIPFEALPVNGSELLIQQFSVSYLPSARLLRERRGGGRGVRWPWETTLEAFADPRPPGLQTMDDAAAGRTWAPLPEASREVNGIYGRIGGRAAIYTGEQARKEVLMRSKPAPLLHFATHAFADTSDPARSYIVFAPAGAAQAFDHLYLNEVDGLALRQVDLVTASACETDKGKMVRGEGVQSFSRAFLAAGARSIVTSLWAVSDRDSADLMLRFYSGLADGEYKADALRTAKLAALGTAASAHPAHWAAFLLNGESDAPIPYVVSWNRLLVVALLLASAVILIRSFLLRKPGERA
jgi:CHAT domain-containing protein